MTAYNIYKKLELAIEAVENYEKEIKSASEISSDDWVKYSRNKMKELETKMHVLGSAGTICPRCNGAGVI